MTVPDPADPSAILAGWREAEQAATEGPWEADVIPALRDRPVVLLPDRGNDTAADLLFRADSPQATEADAEFIATARTAMPLLLGALEAALALPAEWRQESEALRDAAGKVWEDAPDAPGVRLKHAYAAGYAECAKALESAITRELTGKGGTEGEARNE